MTANIPVLENMHWSKKWRGQISSKELYVTLRESYALLPTNKKDNNKK